MREINLIVIHCSATREDRCFTEYDLEECHRRRGFDGAGYHFYIRKNGKIVTTRPVERIGAHAKGFNAHSIGICYEGGLDCTLTSLACIFGERYYGDIEKIAEKYGYNGDKWGTNPLAVKAIILQ